MCCSGVKKAENIEVYRPKAENFDENIKNIIISPSIDGVFDISQELIKRGYNVSIGKIQDKEVDFIATKADKKIYIQVTESIMQENTRDRELQPLKRINDNYEKILLTTDNLFTNTDDEGIKIINLIDWLLKI